MLTEKSFPTVGEMFNRIIIQQVTLTSDGMGGSTESWTDFYSCWAKIMPKKSYEKDIAGHLQSSTHYSVLIRYKSDLTSDMRVSYGDKIFQIKGIMDILEQKKFIELTCVEGEPA